MLLSFEHAQVKRDEALMEDLVKFRAWLVMKIVEHIELHGDRDAVMKLQWPSPQTLRHEEIVQYEWECPPARCCELEDYMKDHGPKEEVESTHDGDGRQAGGRPRQCRVGSIQRTDDVDKA